MNEIPLMKVTRADHSPLSQNEYDIIRKTERTFRIVTLSTFALYTISQLKQMIKMVRDSNTLVGKGQHQILTDMTEDKKAIHACDVLTSRIGKFYDELPEALSHWEYHGVQGTCDHADTWAAMIDCATGIFEPDVKRLSKTLKESFRKVMKPYDGVAFYRCLVTLYLCMVLENLIASYTRSMETSELKPFKRLDFVPCVRSLMLHSSLKDHNGKFIALTFGEKEDEEARIVQKKRFFNGRRTEEWAFYSCDSLVQSNELSRVGYDFEKIMFSFSTLDTINRAVGAKTYDYEKIFHMKYDAPCMTTYPQYALVIALKKGYWKKARLLLDQFVNEIPEYRGRKTQPVFGFFVGDRLEFKGAWNSAGEAARECGWFFKDIAFNVRQNDKRELIEDCDYKKIHNHIWVSLKRFILVLDDLAAA